jgi:hypothetical protein
MIIGVLKMPKCMMRRGIKYQDLEATDILVLPKICLASRMFIEDKFLLLHKKIVFRSEK